MHYEIEERKRDKKDKEGWLREYVLVNVTICNVHDSRIESLRDYTKRSDWVFGFFGGLTAYCCITMNLH